MSIDSFVRKSILTVANLRWVERFFNQYGMKVGVSRFVAAESLKETIKVVQRLNEHQFMVTLDYLGESVTDRRFAEEARDVIIHLFNTINEYSLLSNVSVKLSQIGLHIDPQFCYDNMDQITSAAKQHDNFVRIDMEDSQLTAQTMEIFIKLLMRYGADTIGIVIQSYLYRSLEDIEQLGKLGANIRVVKGAYKEPVHVAYPDKSDVDMNYVKLVKLHLLQGCYTAIATHDVRIIDKIKRLITDLDIPSHQFEFQMLYGISTGLQQQLVQEGYRMRVYTPYGKHWYPYFTRRIAERPANLIFVLKNLFKK